MLSVETMKELVAWWRTNAVEERKRADLLEEENRIEESKLSLKWAEIWDREAEVLEKQILDAHLNKNSALNVNCKKEISLTTNRLRRT